MLSIPINFTLGSDPYCYTSKREEVRFLSSGITFKELL